MQITLVTDTPQFFSDIAEIVRIFLPQAELTAQGGGARLLHTHTQVNGQWIERLSYQGRGVEHAAPVQRGDALLEKRMLKRAVKTACFQLFQQITGRTPPWGSLTGVRPTRLLRGFEASEGSLSKAAERMQTLFHLSPDKAGLLLSVAQTQDGLPPAGAGEVDVYIGIPFCVTRCSYCSFSSGTLGDGALAQPYVDALIGEINGCRDILREKGLCVRAAYMGGGTPTALSAGQLSEVLLCARQAFAGAREWTVEAGRPDTISKEKLLALREHGIGRISINPQTFWDKTLNAIGRAHTAMDTERAYELARSMGFSHINMDIIAALPGEDGADFGHTLSRVLKLDPESVTVHTLAVKRASALHGQGYAADQDAQQMVEMARQALEEGGYLPYYLYRQKYMASNLENVGYAKRGYACLYNVDMMEETVSTLGMGAGAITKWLFLEEPRLRRAPNLRNIQAYISRVPEMLERKRRLIFEGIGDRQGAV